MDGFRIPDVLARSGAILREVGTTNRTRAADYDRAVGPETALLLRVHQSNFRVLGFTEQPAVKELAAVAKRHSLPLVDDLGSGAFFPFEDEPSARDSLTAGADLACFSGDKLLGGPQAGVIVGRADLVERLRRHPLQRALRADKLTLAALEGTLRLYLDPERAAREIPVLRMLGEDAAAVRARAERLAALVGGEVEETVGRAGGGALPLAELPSFACAVEEDLARPLRIGNPPVVGVVRDGRLLLDCRTLDRSRGRGGRRSGHRRAGMSSLPPEALLWSLQRGAMAAQALRVVAELGVADALADGPRRIDELSGDFDVGSVRRVLRALASDGIFEEVEPDVFRNTPASELLRTDGDGAWHEFALLFGREWYESFARFPEAVETGRPPSRSSSAPISSHGCARIPTGSRSSTGRWPPARRSASAGSQTSTGTTRRSSTSAAAPARCCPSSSDATPDCTGSCSTCPRWSPESSRLTAVEVVSGDFLAGVPAGDAYVVSRILHGLDDVKAALVLANIRAAARPGARVLLIEAVIPRGNAPSEASGSIC